MRILVSIFSVLCLCTAFAPVANAEGAGHAGMHMNTQDHGKSVQLSEGTVKKVKAGGKVTIAHGPLVNLGMPPMTMTFRVTDRALIKGVKPGDKVRFHAEESGDALVITEMHVIH
jgi:Cu(I)/Ag(I) efflux system protein CusF